MKVALIAAFNEEQTINSVVRDALRYVDNVIVIDDGSTDSTAELVRQAGAVVLNQEVNQGYDRALQRGFEYAMKIGAHIIVTLDADGQHNPHDIPMLIQPIVSGNADLVVSQRSALNRFAEKIFALYTKHYYGVPDPLCGFKAYSGHVYEKIGYFDNLSSIGTQLTLQAVALGFKVHLMPVQIKNRADVSRFYTQRLRGNWKIFKAMIKIIAYVKKSKI
ncbi:MAG: glycosyltransferase family 2 protein [Parcubacteria group bacterium]